ncbi:pheromone A receptor-domain-containing protein [Scheffersomyces xylosifermentans]|uniref:pheromone A receptor-domain-containing protein n=1 Tax=Scheffersomyces xylosifermentans TaxID=1304137 RepID=UPI00315DBB54
MNPKAAGVAALSLISFFILIPPFVWHCRCKNTPAICLIFWFLFLNLNTFINLFIWSGDDFAETWNGKVWCDVTTKLEAGSSSGKIAAISALSLNLYMILCAKNPVFMETGSWRKVAIDLSICLITPIFVMATNYIILINRYVIVRYQGCTSSYVLSGATIGLYSIWNILWCFVAMVFATLTLYKYYQKRKDVRDILRCTNSGLNIKRFARLLIFSLLIILALAPLAIYYFVGDVKIYKGPFDWSRFHNPNWGTILYADFGFYLLYDKFVNIGLSFITFFLFGLGSDSLEMYKSLFRRFGFKFNTKSEDQEAGVQTTRQNSYIARLPQQTKVNSGKSQGSGASYWTNSSTMPEFNKEFNEVVNEHYNLDSPETPEEKQKCAVSTLELGKSEYSESPTQYEDEDSNDELHFILNETNYNEVDEGFGYNYSVKQNDPKN